MNRFSKKQIIIAAALLVVVAAVITALVLVLVNPRTTKKEEAATRTIDTTQVIATILGDEDLLKTAQGATMTQAVKDAQITLLVKSTALDATFQQPTDTYASLSSEKGLNASERDTYFSALSKQFVSEGMTKETNFNNDATKISFTASNAYCQAAAQPSTDGLTHLITIGCTDKASIQATEANLKELLGLWPGNGSKAANLLITERKTQVETGEAAVVSLINQTSLRATNRLVYAKSASGDWKLIGDAANGTAVEANDKYIITAEIKAAFDDTTYGPALKSILEV